MLYLPYGNEQYATIELEVRHHLARHMAPVAESMGICNVFRHAPLQHATQPRFDRRQHDYDLRHNIINGRHC